MGFHKSFSVKYDKITNVLSSKIVLSKPSRLGPYLLKIEFAAIWDTGATKTNITTKVARALKLDESGLIECLSVDGYSMKPTYDIDALIPNNVKVLNLEVIGDANLGGFDVLVGMDIINLGDFVICNERGMTSFSFRMPPKKRINFAE